MRPWGQETAGRSVRVRRRGHPVPSYRALCAQSKWGISLQTLEMHTYRACQCSEHCPESRNYRTREAPGSAP